MSPLTKQMWLDAWAHLLSARRAVDEARTADEKERALATMALLSDTLKSASISYASAISYTEMKKKDTG